jgi:hypothetical protein
MGANSECRIQLLYRLAEKVRTVAEAMHDLNFRRTMYLTAASYDRMAKQLDERNGLLSLPVTRSPRLSP